MIIPIVCQWEVDDTAESAAAGGVVPPRLPEWIIFDMQGNVVPTGGGGSGGGGGEGFAAAAAAAAATTSTLDGVAMGVLTLKEKVRRVGVAFVAAWTHGSTRRDIAPHPSQDGSKVVLQVGNHRVAGELEVLGKPLLLIQKHRLAPPPPGDGSAVAGDDGAPAATAPPAAAPGSVEYVARAVVRRKLVFRERPQPIVGASPAAAAGGAM